MKTLKFFSLALTFIFLNFPNNGLADGAANAALATSQGGISEYTACLISHGNNTDPCNKIKAEQNSDKFYNGVQACRNYTTLDKKGDPNKPPTSCDLLADCSKNVECGDVAGAIEKCARALRVADPDAGTTSRTKDSENTDDSIVTSNDDSKLGSYIAVCTNQYKTPSDPTSENADYKTKQKAVFAQLAIDGQKASPSDACRGLKIKELAKNLSKLSEDATKDRKDTETKNKEAIKAFDTTKAECIKDQVSLDSRLNSAISDSNVKAADLQNKLVDENAKATAALNTMKVQLASAQLNVQKLQGADKQAVEAAYYDKQLQIRQTCNDAADKYIQTIQAQQAALETGMRNQTQSLGQALTNAAVGGNAGQNAATWTSYVSKCMGRNSGVLTSAYNKYLNDQQNLVALINQSLIQVAKLTTDVRNATINNTQQNAGAYDSRTAAMAAANQKTSSLRAELQSLSGPKGTCTEKIKHAGEDRDDAKDAYDLAIQNEKGLEGMAGLTSDSSTSSRDEQKDTADRAAIEASAAMALNPNYKKLYCSGESPTFGPSSTQNGSTDHGASIPNTSTGDPHNPNAK